MPAIETKVFKSGDIIIKEGTRGTCAYIIESGEVEVSTGHKGIRKVLTTLGSKRVFGEMGLIEDKPRSATVIAIKDTALRVINRASFNELFSKNPKIILSLLNALIERLRSLTLSIAEDNAKNNVEFADKDDEKQQVFIKDNRYVVISGTNDISKKVLHDKDLTVTAYPFRVGRKSVRTNTFIDNDLEIDEREEPHYVSSKHFLIDKFEGHFALVNLGSNSGLIVDKEEVKSVHVLQKNESEITVGSIFSPFSFKIAIKGNIEASFNPGLQI